jgi:hypothetical protein
VVELGRGGCVTLGTSVCGCDGRLQGAADFRRCQPFRGSNSIIIELFAHLALIMMQIFDMMMLF